MSLTLVASIVLVIAIVNLILTIISKSEREAKRKAELDKQKEQEFLFFVNSVKEQKSYITSYTIVNDDLFYSDRSEYKSLFLSKPLNPSDVLKKFVIGFNDEDGNDCSVKRFIRVKPMLSTDDVEKPYITYKYVDSVGEDNYNQFYDATIYLPYEEVSTLFPKTKFIKN